ncbi:MAG: hypothetical protein V2A34_02745, partial [Lentisphaerota bacterium]
MKLHLRLWSVLLWGWAQGFAAVAANPTAFPKYSQAYAMDHVIVQFRAVPDDLQQMPFQTLLNATNLAQRLGLPAGCRIVESQGSRLAREELPDPSRLTGAFLKERWCYLQL